MKLLYTCLTFIIISTILIAKPSDRIRFNSYEITQLEYNFFTKIDNSDTNNIDIYYDGFLIASSITNEEEFNIYKSKLNDIRLKAKRDLNAYVNEGAYNFGNILLRWLYESGTLKKYFAKATLIQDLIDRGEYNCLSSSILYALLYKEFGFEVNGVLTQDHAFCTVITENGDIDVETTLAQGFNPGTKEIEQMANFQRITYVPKYNYANRKNVDIQTLIASLYANSISILKRSINDPLEELAMYKKGYYLAPNFTLFENNIVASMNKIALSNIKTGNYEEAQKYFDAADSFSPGSKITKNNRIHYYNTIGTIYLNKKDYPSAIQTFKEGIMVMGTDSGVLKTNLKVAYYNYAVNEYNSQRYNNANFISDEALLLFPKDRDFLRLKSSIPK